MLICTQGNFHVKRRKSGAGECFSVLPCSRPEAKFTAKFWLNSVSKCALPLFSTLHYYLFNQTDLERHRQLREAVSCSTEVCSCLLPIASASFHLHHTFLLLVLVRAHVYLQRCSLTENTLTSFPLCIDSGLLKHLLFFPTTPVLFSIVFGGHT